MVNLQKYEFYITLKNKKHIYFLENNSFFGSMPDTMEVKVQKIIEDKLFFIDHKNRKSYICSGSISIFDCKFIVK